VSPTVVVVGASLGGLRAAEQLRAQGFDGSLVVLGDEPHMPYNRPPLSKEALLGSGADVTADELVSGLAFRPRAAATGIDWRLGRAVTSADLRARTVTLGGEEVLAYDGLVAATGLRPRRLPQVQPAGGRHVVRTAGDAARLRRDIGPGTRAVVVGAGFIGCETAATLRGLGCDVVVVEPQEVPMLRGVGAEVGAALLEHHAAAGVRFVTGQGVARLVGDDRVTGVVLDDGTLLHCDVVVESVGSHCNTEWLAGNGLDLSDGLLCDNGLRVEGRRDVVAVGDIARFPNPRFDDVPRRVEHWSIPGDTARRAAASVIAHLSGDDPAAEPFTPLPAFWSDQFGLRLQSFGAPGLADSVDVVEGHLGRLGDGTAVVYRLAGEPVGVLLVNVPVSQHAGYRALLTTTPQLV
jgi:NADPH-dependent 2,4-dienoyl-CoA reductase/sulfur reductase-like enzyme